MPQYPITVVFFLISVWGGAGMWRRVEDWGGYRIFTDQLQNLPTKKSVRVFFLIHTKAYIDFSEAGGPRSKPDPPSVFAPKARKFLGAFPRICPKDPQKTGLSKRPQKKKTHFDMKIHVF